MFANPRTKPQNLTLCECLKPRMMHSEKMANQLDFLTKGYEGEQHLDRLLAELACEAIVLRDLRLDVNQSFVQIDTMLIVNGAVYMFEVKNFAGEYEIVDDRWCGPSGKEVNNPVTQLKRSEPQIRKLLQRLRPAGGGPLRPYVVCPNPRFTLFSVPRGLPLLLPTQLPDFLQKLNSISAKLDEAHYRLSDTLLANQAAESPFKSRLEYKYEELMKGVFCKSCMGKMEKKSLRNLACIRCGGIESVRDSLIRSVEEFKLLFPEKDVTPRQILDWSSGEFGYRTLQRILSDHFTKKVSE